MSLSTPTLLLIGCIWHWTLDIGFYAFPYLKIILCLCMQNIIMLTTPSQWMFPYGPQKPYFTHNSRFGELDWPRSIKQLSPFFETPCLPLVTTGHPVSHLLPQVLQGTVQMNRFVPQCSVFSVQCHSCDRYSDICQAKLTFSIKPKYY